MIWHWRYYQAYFLTLLLPYLNSYPTGNVYQSDSALSGYLIRQSRDLSWKPFSTITPFNFSAQPQVSMDKINRNPGFSSSTSTSNAERIDTKNPKLELASALGVAIDINGPLGEVGSSFQGSQNTGKGATSQAGALTGNKGKKGPANAQTAAQANIVVDDPNAEATAGVRNSANVIMSGNAKGNAQSAGSVNTKAPDGTITTLAPPAADTAAIKGFQQLHFSLGEGTQLQTQELRLSPPAWRPLEFSSFSSFIPIPRMAR